MLILAVAALPGWSRGEEPAARPDHIALDVRRNWEPATFSFNQVKSSFNTALDCSGDAPKFSSQGLGRGGSFLLQIMMPVDLAKYPTMSIRYKARGVNTSRTDAAIFVYQHYYTPAFRCDE